MKETFIQVYSDKVHILTRIFFNIHTELCIDVAKLSSISNPGDLCGYTRGQWMFSLLVSFVYLSKWSRLFYPR